MGRPKGAKNKPKAIPTTRKEYIGKTRLLRANFTDPTICGDAQTTAADNTRRQAIAIEKKRAELLADESYMCWKIREFPRGSEHIRAHPESLYGRLYAYNDSVGQRFVLDGSCRHLAWDFWAATCNLNKHQSQAPEDIPISSQRYKRMHFAPNGACPVRLCAFRFLNEPVDEDGLVAVHIVRRHEHTHAAFHDFRNRNRADRSKLARALRAVEVSRQEVTQAGDTADGLVNTEILPISSSGDSGTLDGPIPSAATARPLEVSFTQPENCAGNMDGHLACPAQRPATAGGGSSEELVLQIGRAKLELQAVRSKFPALKELEALERSFRLIQEHAQALTFDTRPAPTIGVPDGRRSDFSSAPDNCHDYPASVSVLRPTPTRTDVVSGTGSELRTGSERGTGAGVGPAARSVLGTVTLSRAGQGPGPASASVAGPVKRPVQGPVQGSGIGQGLVSNSGLERASGSAVPEAGPGSRSSSGQSSQSLLAAVSGRQSHLATGAVPVTRPGSQSRLGTAAPVGRNPQPGLFSLQGQHLQSGQGTEDAPGRTLASGSGSRSDLGPAQGRASQAVQGQLPLPAGQNHESALASRSDSESRLRSISGRSVAVLTSASYSGSIQGQVPGRGQRPAQVVVPISAVGSGPGRGQGHTQGSTSELRHALKVRPGPYPVRPEASVRPAPRPSRPLPTLRSSPSRPAPIAGPSPSGLRLAPGSTTILSIPDSTIGPMPNSIVGTRQDSLLTQGSAQAPVLWQMDS